MAAQVIPLADVPEVMWRNGLGTTREILRVPDDDGWLWRLSVAVSSGPARFSCFQGVQRQLMPVQGSGLRLRHDDGCTQDVLLGAVQELSGEEGVVGEPLAGPSHQLNLMWRPKAVTASITGLVRDSELIIDVAPASYRLFHLLTGRAWVGPAATRLSAQDTGLLLPSERGRRLRLEVSGAVATILVVPHSPVP